MRCAMRSGELQTILTVHYKVFTVYSAVFKGSSVCAALHEEPYILFSTENKSLLCIKCFRDMQV